LQYKDIYLGGECQIFDRQIIERKMVGDTGFEPVTSTVCKRHKKKGRRKI